jgi:hypothetical protein
MNACTEGYDALVLDNTSRSNKIEDCVFWYKAKPDRQFKIGDPSIWKFNTKYLSEEFVPKSNKKTNVNKLNKTRKIKNDKNDKKDKKDKKEKKDKKKNIVTL